MNYRPALLRSVCAVLVFTCLFSVELLLAGDLLSELPAGGVRLIAEEKTAPDQLVVNLGGGKLGQKQVLDVKHAAFAKSLQVQLTAQPQNTWDTSISTQTTEAVKKDDVLLIGFWARGKPLEGVGGGVAEVVFETNGAPYTKSVQYLVETPSDGSWQHYWVRFRSLQDYALGGATVTFQTGYLKEEFELAGLEVWNFGDAEFESLPHTPLTYAGREPDADWRTEADQRIDKIRKSDLEITVIGADGNPVVDASVRVHQQAHAFDFGTAATADMIAGDHEQKAKYREVLLKHFNVATIENGLKWKYWDKYPDNRRQTLEAIDWLNENGVAVRGHVMVWPGHRYLPEWIKTIEDQPDVLSKVIDGHISELGYAVQGKVRDWDVVNEIFDNRDLTNALGDEAMIHWFEEARRVSPGVDLYYNDYAGLVRGGHPTAHKDHYERTIKYMIDNNAPIDGIGIQGHFGSLLTPPKRLLSELDRWNALGLKIQITEFDVTVPDEQLRSDFARDFLIACFSHEAVDGIVTWGFWEGAHWEPKAALFDNDWNPTAIGKHWIELTQNRWWTDKTLTTDKDGKLSLRGFKGTYSVECGGVSEAVILGDEEATVTLKLR
jgi:GH35 family endo-1,4-beta-xylanase